MELLDTPNPNAKKILLNEIAKDTIMKSESEITENLHKLNGVVSVFFGPGFVTVIKNESTDWEEINQDIINIFDKL